uniref:Conserved oligomeric Golgi complex subunit 2 n=1 Tax=Ciona intestinalis TaxID=7719 RepID=H2XKN8_CIOIN
VSLLPIAPSTLCFDKNEFMKADFSVDHFVADCRRRVQLETLRQDLEIYFKVLKNAMIELINKDYADFVNLSSNLVGMNKAIELLREPLSKIKVDVGEVVEVMKNKVEEVERSLGHQKMVGEKRILLSHMKGLLQAVEKIEHIQRSDDSNTGQVLERIAGEFNQLQHHATFCKGLPVLNHIRPRISDITSNLQNGLEGELVQGIASSDLRSIHRCLNSYALIGKTKDAESLVRAHVVQPCLHQVIVEHNGDSGINNLKYLFNKILESVPAQLKLLCDITSGRQLQLGDQFRGIPGYDFMINSAWPEVVSSLETNLPGIFASGDPDMFHKRYKLCMEFICNFERHCGSQASIIKLRQSDSYNVLMTHWSLPVYFQIRFQEIGGNFESVLSNTEQALLSEEGKTFRLKSTSVLWDCIRRCWNIDVFLPSLMHRFWKLTLQLLARYKTWIQKIQREQIANDSQFPLGKVAEIALDIEALVDHVNTFYLDEIQPKATKQGLKDVDILQINVYPVVCQLQSYTTILQYPNIPINPGALNDIFSELKTHKDDLINHIVTSLSSQSIVFLKQAQDVPRLFRKTNRPTPTEQSTYVTNLMKPIVAFHGGQTSYINDELLSHWLTQVAIPISDRFHSVVSEVLTSVRKMEESLLRLQKMRSGGKSSSSNLAALAGSSLSDDDKIRLQLFIDVTSFGKQMSACGGKMDTIPVYQKLFQLVEEAKKNPS